MKTIKISGTEFNAYLDNGEWPENVAEVVEQAIANMQDNPGQDGETIQIVIVNDFESEEDEDEETNLDHDNTETPKE